MSQLTVSVNLNMGWVWYAWYVHGRDQAMLPKRFCQGPRKSATPNSSRLLVLADMHI